MRTSHTHTETNIHTSETHHTTSETKEYTHRDQLTQSINKTNTTTIIQTQQIFQIILTRKQHKQAYTSYTNCDNTY